MRGGRSGAVDPASEGRVRNGRRREVSGSSTTASAGIGLTGRHSFTAPSLEFMMRFWNRKNITATGIVMMIAAASLSGY